MTTTARWLDVEQQAAWRAFLAVQARLTAQLGRDMQAESGLSLPDFSVLVPLSEHPEGRMRVLELARALDWEKSRLSHQLTRMVARGLVDRSGCPEDRRGSFVTLTERGRNAVEDAAPPHVDAVRRYLFDVLDDGQVAALHTICSTMLDALEPGDPAHCAQD